MDKVEYIKSQEWLINHVNDSNVKVVDCRFTLGKPELGKEAYAASHIPGAVHFDLEEDLSSLPMEHGGRHPLPDLQKLKEKLELSGIDSSTTIISYDNGEGSYAARFWWLLTYMGLKNVYILDGGFSKWVKAGNRVNQVIPTFNKTKFEIDIQENMLATYEEVKDNLGSQSAILIDSRANSRFVGLEEPIDKRPGHIPGAINIVWEESLENGYWKPLEKQKDRFTRIDAKKPIIVYCGSGVTATPNILALKAAGYENVKLYAGSYSDWVSYQENPVDLGE